MKLSVDAVDVIARETIQLLVRDGDIEIDPRRMARAELDLSTVMREYFTHKGRASQATRMAIEQRGYSYASFARVFGLEVGSSDLRHVIHRLVDQLLASPELKVVIAEEGLLAQKILLLMMKHVEDDSQLQGLSKR
jgi:uncharacterized protein